MKLLDEIIDLASNDVVSLSALLRKLLVLSHQLKNQRLKDWVGNELNGFDQGAELPAYRVVRAIAKGHFTGAFQSEIRGQPIPSAALKKEHKSFAEEVQLRQPIAAYNITKNKDGEANSGMIEWPPNLVLLYQSTFYGGDYALARAWQEIPSSVIVGLADTVRTRVLQFALELKDELGDDSENPSEIAPEKVESKVTNYIFGGTNIIAAEAKQFEQTTSITVNQNDIISLQNALSTIGIESPDFKALTSALEDDNKGKAEKGIGAKTASWVASIGKTVGKEGLKVGADVAKSAALGWIRQHLGLP